MKTQAEIDAEKADYVKKPATQHVPPELEMAAGRAIGYGTEKHGVATPDGWGTWRIPGTSQADPLLHYGCLRRHLAEWRANPDSVDPESGLSHLDHAAAQLAILLDLVARPVVPPGTIRLGTITGVTFAPGAIEGEDPDVDGVFCELDGARCYDPNCVAVGAGCKKAKPPCP